MKTICMNPWVCEFAINDKMSCKVSKAKQGHDKFKPLYVAANLKSTDRQCYILHGSLHHAT